MKSNYISPLINNSNQRKTTHATNTANDLNFATWNVRTLNYPGALRSLIMELTKYDIQVAAIQETRWKENNMFSSKNYQIYSSGNTEDKHVHGTAFIVSKQYNNNILSFNPISQRISTLRLKGRFHNITFINIYAPTEVSEETTKDDFYGKLDSVFNGVPKNDIKIVLGDMNAQIGKEEVYHPTIGNYSLHEVTNDNGQRFIDFAMSNELVVSSTCFMAKRIHKYTWESADGITKNQIDHVAISMRHANNILDVKTKRGAIFDSDHHMVKIKFRMRISVAKKEKSSKKDRIDYDKLRNPDVVHQFQAVLETKINNHNLTDSTEEDHWNTIQEVITSTSKSILGYQRTRRNQDWWDEECNILIQKRNDLRRIMIQRKTRSNTEAYKVARANFKKTCRLKKREKLEREITQLEENHRNQNVREMYKQVKNVKKGFEPRIQCIEDENKTMLHSEEQILVRWKQYFSQLLNSTNFVNTQEDDLNDNIIIEPPTLEEVRMVIDKAKNNKSPGLDGIPMEIFKHGGDVLLGHIHSIVNKIWITECMPTQWKTAVIIPIHKKGSKLQCLNYRGISLLNTAYKIFTTIIADKLKPYSYEIIGEYQSGFRPNKTTTDQIFSIRQIFEKGREYNLNTSHIFIDYKQAFDSLDRNFIWNSMKELGVPCKLIRLAKATTTDSQNVIKVQNNFSQPFATTSGVRQGDGLSTELFIFAVECIVRNANLRSDDTIWGSSIQLLAFADDKDLIGRSVISMKEAFVKLEEEASKGGLCINQMKTKIMLAGNEHWRRRFGQNITIDEYNFEVVDSFKYLGSYVNPDNNCTMDICERIKSANRAFYSLSAYLRSHLLNNDLKLRLYQTIVRPILAYGCEAWTLKSTDIELLERTERKFIRRITGPIRTEDGRYKIRPNEEIRDILNHETIISHIKSQRLRWAGHVARLDQGSTVKKLFLSTPPGRRAVGRPKSRWIDGVNADLLELSSQFQGLSLENWMEVAKDRDEWRRIVWKAKAVF